MSEANRRYTDKEFALIQAAAVQDTLAGLIRATREAGEPPTRSPRTLP